MAIVPKADIRRDILDKTRVLLVQHGITHLSIRMIAREAKCSVGTIYFYFESKDQLFHALIEEGFDKLIEQLEAGMAEPVLDPVERVRTLCRTYIRFGLENPEYYEIMFMLKPERMARYPAEKYRKARRSIEVFGDVLAAAHAEGPLTVPDPYLQANIIWSFMHGIVSLLQVKRIDRRIDETVLIESAIDRIVDGNRSPSE